MNLRKLIILIVLTTKAMAGQSQPGNSKTYIHPEPASFKSQLLQTLMVVLGRKKTLEKNLTRNTFPSVAAPIPNSLQTEYGLQASEVNQRKVWTFRPQHRPSRRVILYIHGGGYISNLTKYDWDLIRALLIKTNCTIVVPDYPLAPASNYQDVYDYFDKLYLNLLADTSPDDIIFLGNSAGGGIALGLAQKLRNDKKSQPSQIILNSPWLDITMSNPEISQIDKKDRLLGIKGLEMAGKAYAAGLNATDYRVSPIYGDLSSLGKISIFIGTHDVFLADARRLKLKLENKNIPVNYFEYPKMFHVWMAVTSLKESKHAINQITMLINSQD